MNIILHNKIIKKVAKKPKLAKKIDDLKKIHKIWQNITKEQKESLSQNNYVFNVKKEKDLKVISNINFIDLKKQQQKIKNKINKKIKNVLAHGQYILGPEVQILEKKLANYCNVKHCITTASGTDSLLIALMALKIEVGDEVITVPYTWISTAEMIALCGAKPVFVDIDKDTFNMDPNKLESAITNKTKAIMPVSIFGQCPDMDKINEIARKYKVPVIEDAAQSFGASYKNKKSCSLSTIGTTSFFPSKPLGCYGDGGAIFTNDDVLAEKFIQIRNHGQKNKHDHPIIGINGRFDTIQAAITIEKLKIFPKECVLRQKVAESYNESLNSIQTPKIPIYNRSVYAQYTIIHPKRDELKKILTSKNIPSVAYYKKPLHLQECFSFLKHKIGDFPITEKISDDCLSLPMNPYLSKKQIKFICSEINHFSNLHAVHS